VCLLYVKCGLWTYTALMLWLAFLFKTYLTVW